MDALKLEINPALILNMDETGCSSKPDKNTKIKCVVHSGSLIKPYFQEKDDYRQVSIVSTISLNGTSLKPLLIIPRKRYINELSILDVYDDMDYIYSESGYMNEECMLHYINEILSPYIFTQRLHIGSKFSPCILIMDNLKCHNTLEVSNTFSNIKDFQIIFLPPHSSHFLQPLDLSFFGIFKHYYSQCRSINPADTLKQKVLNIHKALYQTSCIDNIKKSFSCAGIGISTNEEGKKEIFFDTEKIEKLISQGIGE